MRMGVVQVVEGTVPGRGVVVAMVTVFFALRAREGEVLDAVQKQLRRATKMRHGPWAMATDALPIAGDCLRQRLGRVDATLALRMCGDSGHGDGIDESNHVGRDFPSRPDVIRVTCYTVRKTLREARKVSRQSSA